MSQESPKLNDENDKANFETAISATQFGKFNYMLILCSISAAMTPIIDNTVMSYVIPVAHCDLNISLRQKGTLNSAVFIGTLLSSYFWGFLGDTFGRKRLLLIAYTLDLIFNVLGAFMPNFLLQYIFKFLVGFVTSGPYALIITYMSEFYSTQYRSKVILMLGISMVTILAILPAVAMVVMPLPDLIISSYAFHSWQLFMLLSSIAALISAILFVFLPESPKFFMTSGKNEEALKIFKMIYSWNTGNPEETYPIKVLCDESQTTNTIQMTQNLEIQSLSKPNIFKLLQTGLLRIKPMFNQPYLLNIFLVFVIHFGILQGANSLRLWLPQIFTSMDEYNQIHGSSNATICEVIENSYSRNSSNLSISTTEEKIDEECVITLTNTKVYINAIYAGIACISTNLILVVIINYCRKNILLVTMMSISGCAVLSIYWTPNQEYTIGVSAVNVALAISSSTILMSLVVELFPTSLRGVAVSLTLMAGQLGALIGNLIFPYLLEAGCLPPFLFLGCVVISSALLCLTLPNPSGKDFK